MRGRYLTLRNRGKPLASLLDPGRRVRRVNFRVRCLDSGGTGRDSALSVQTTIWDLHPIEIEMGCAHNAVSVSKGLGDRCVNTALIGSQLIEAYIYHARF